MRSSEVIVFIIYLAFMLGIGIRFFFKDKNGGEKTYFLGGRKMGPWVTALSAAALLAAVSPLFYVPDAFPLCGGFICALLALELILSLVPEGKAG